MVEISQIRLPNGETYQFKDVVAREAVAIGLSALVVDTLPTASASTKGVIYLVQADNEANNNTYDEFITVEIDDTFKWEQIGSTVLDLSNYSQKEHTHTVTTNVTIEGAEYTPAGSVTSGFTGTAGDVTVSGTPTGTVSAPAISVKDGATAADLYSMSSDGSYTASSFTPGTTPNTYAFAVNNDVLEITETAGTAAVYTPEQVTLPARTKLTVTAAAPTFTGNAMDSTGTYTPAGNVSSTFSGTAATITPTAKNGAVTTSADASN